MHDTSGCSLSPHQYLSHPNPAPPAPQHLAHPPRCVQGHGHKYKQNWLFLSKIVILFFIFHLPHEAAGTSWCHCPGWSPSHPDDTTCPLLTPFSSPWTLPKFSPHQTQFCCFCTQIPRFSQDCLWAGSTAGPPGRLHHRHQATYFSSKL